MARVTGQGEKSPWDEYTVGREWNLPEPTRPGQVIPVGREWDLPEPIRPGQVIPVDRTTRDWGNPYAEKQAEPYPSYRLPAQQLSTTFCSPIGLDFGTALRFIRAGYRARRTGWNGKGMWIALQRPDAGSKMTRPYIYMSTADGGLVPWLASQADLLTDDWELLP